MVVSLIKDEFQTFDYNGEFYHTMQVPDSVETDIRGVQVNADGTLLAVWTESNSIYIFKRGNGSNIYHSEEAIEWTLSQEITAKEGYIGTTVVSEGFSHYVLCSETTHSL